MNARIGIEFKEALQNVADQEAENSLLRGQVRQLSIRADHYYRALADMAEATGSNINDYLDQGASGD